MMYLRRKYCPIILETLDFQFQRLQVTKDTQFALYEVESLPHLPTGPWGGPDVDRRSTVCVAIRWFVVVEIYVFRKHDISRATIYASCETEIQSRRIPCQNINKEDFTKKHSVKTFMNLITTIPPNVSFTCETGMWKDTRYFR